MNWIIAVFALVGLICWSAVVRYDIQMFQQNSYRYSRYWTWLKKGNFLSHGRWFFLLFTVWWLLSWNPGSVWMLAIAFAIYPIVEFRQKYKIRIAYTARVKRLIAVDFILTVLLNSLVYIYAGQDWFILSFILSLLFSKVIVVAADFLLKPLEKQINLYYIRDARRILASSKDLLIIGITGSFGKTSTKNILYRVLSEKYNVLMTPGNFNTTLGVVRTIREHLKPYHQVFIVEMGAKQVGDIKEICDLVHPHIGIVTSVGNMHLETFKTLQGVGRTKFELLDSLPSDGLGIINMDSEGIAAYPDKPAHCRIMTSAIKTEGVDVKAQNVAYSRRGVSFDVCIKGKESYRVETRLLGEGNILNVLVSLAAADHLGVSVKQQRSALASLQPVEHRLSISNKGGLTVLDDAYNSNPTGAGMALAVLRQMASDAGSKGIVVTPGFVELGSQQEEANRGLGRDIAANADKAIIVNKYNRQAIVEGLKDGGFKEEDMYCVDSLDQAVVQLGAICSQGDVVLYENDLPDTFK